MSDYVYYVNGDFVPANQSAVALNDLGFVRGYGVFDLLRTYGSAPFGLRPHLERLVRSAAQVDLALPWSIEQLEEIVGATLAHNDPTDVSIRIVVTGGPSASFIVPENRPSLLVMIAPAKDYSPQIYAEGASLITVDFPRFMPTVKSLNYIAAIMGQERARSQGAVEALYRTADGRVSECTTANFFILRDDQLVTPDTDILPGITRAFVLEMAEDLFEIVFRLPTYAELAQADEAFVTSTTKEVMPIVRIDDMPIGDGRPGPRTQRLLELFRARTRENA